MEHNYNKYYETAEILKVLAHPVRLCIVSRLLGSGECNVTFMQNCLNTPQSTLSQHLQRLRAVGIVECRRSGLEMFYKIKNEKIVKLISEILAEEQNISHAKDPV